MQTSPAVELKNDYFPLLQSKVANFSLKFQICRISHVYVTFH